MARRLPLGSVTWAAFGIFVLLGLSGLFAAVLLSGWGLTTVLAGVQLAATAVVLVVVRYDVQRLHRQLRRSEDRLRRDLDSKSAEIVDTTRVEVERLTRHVEAAWARLERRFEEQKQDRTDELRDGRGP